MRSLHNHVPNERDLLTGMLELVIEEIETPGDLDWRRARRANAISTC